MSMWINLTDQDHETVSIPWKRIVKLKNAQFGCLVYLDDGTNIHVRESRDQVMQSVEAKQFYDRRNQGCT